MLGKILKAAAGTLCVMSCIMKVNAVSEKIIYIQEDNIAAFSQMAAEFFSHIWKDAVSIAAASVCTALMLILAIKLKKR